MTIPALGVGTGQAVQDCGLGMFKIGKAQDGLGFLAIDSGARLLLHGLRASVPPNHDPTSSLAVLSCLPIIRPESAARVSTLTSIHTKSLQPQLERCQLRIAQTVRTADRSCSRNHL